MERKKIAFFDFDGTLTTKDTLKVFSEFAAGKAKFYAALVKTAPWIAGWKLGFVSNSAAKEKLFGNIFSGMALADFNALGEKFAGEIDKIQREKTVAAVKRFKAKRVPVVIVSASMANWIEPWARKIGIDRVLSTEPEVDGGGKLTGRFATPNCHGAEKVNRIREAYPDIESYESWGFGDSSGDDSMLEIVTHPERL